MAVLVGKKAPSFSADAVVNGGEFVEGFSLDQYIGKKYVLFFFYHVKSKYPRFFFFLLNYFEFEFYYSPTFLYFQEFL